MTRIGYLFAVLVAALLAGCASTPVAVERSPEPVMYVEQLVGDVTVGTIALYVDLYRSIGPEAVVSRSGGMKPYFFWRESPLWIKKRYLPLEEGDQIHRAASDMSLFRRSANNPRLVGSMTAHLVFCDSEVPTDKSCYLIERARLLVTRHDGKTLEQHNFSGPISDAPLMGPFAAFAMLKNAVSDNYGGYAIVDVYGSSIRYVSRSDYQKSTDRLKTEAQQPFGDQKLKNLAEQRNRTIFDSNRTVLLADSGTPLFCTYGGGVPAPLGANLNALNFRCDKTGDLDVKVETLLAERWDIVSELRTPDPRSTGQGQVINLRLKKR